MGVWGTGNFENDTAADYLSLITSQIAEEIEEAISHPNEIEPDEFEGVVVPCKLEILYLFAKQHWVGLMLPDSALVIKWKKEYLFVWDQYMEKSDSKEEYINARRKVIAKTFDQLIKYLKKPV